MQKRITANKDALLVRARPVTPWPTVHPPARAEPNPTKNPATIRTASSVFLTYALVSYGSKSI